MIINKQLLDNLSAQAKENPRLRFSFDMRTSPNDTSQRMLNALEPGTKVPIHRHRVSTETVACLRGKCVQYLYDNDGRKVDEVLMMPGTDCMAMSVEVGQWHRIECLESGTVILECKDGAYEPLSAEDVFID